jgi:hypothetical protein
MVSTEEQLEFEFMKNQPDPIEITEKQERYDEYIKRMYRETEEKDANI